ncbi:MAG: tetratricopeptide repeat protein [Pirellulales bacterium]
MTRKKQARDKSDHSPAANDAAVSGDDDRSRKSRRDRRGAGGPRARLSWRKKLAFAAVSTVVAMSMIEGGLWLFGVRPVIATEDPYVGFSSLSPLFVETTGDDGKVWMVTADNKRKAFNAQRFLRDKPDGTYRIFCLGGSTTFGRPYDDATSFCGFLRKYLPAADSSHEWEVINCGGISYASYREAILVEEACRYEPDLFIFYGSQNEFLEARTYHTVIETPPMIRGLGSLASRTRVYAAAHWAVQAARGEPDDAERDVLDEDVKTRLDRSVGPVDYTRNDEERKQIVAHFRFNLSRMIDTARANGAEVLLVQPASNLRNCSPFKSEHAADVASDDKKLAEYREAYDDAKSKLDAAMKLAAVVSKANTESKSKAKTRPEKAAKSNAEETAQPKPKQQPDSKASPNSEKKIVKDEGDTNVNGGKAIDKSRASKSGGDKSDDGISVAEQGARAIFEELKRSLDAIDRAIAIDPRYADGHYFRGQVLDQLNEFSDAKLAYQRALDEDVCPLRAVHEISDVISDVAANRKADVIDFAKLIAELSPQSIAGREWFMDHVHPSPGGNQILSQAIVDEMLKKGVVRDSGAWTAEVKKRVGDTVIARIDSRKHGEAMRNLSKVFEWAGKRGDAAYWANAAVTQVPDDPEALFRAAAGAAAREQLETALDLYERCRRLDPAAAITYNNMGELYERTGQFDEALKLYRSAVKYATLRGESKIAVQARTLVGGALMKLDRLDEAEKELRGAIAQDPTYAEASHRLGLLYLQKKEPQLALEMFVAARRIEPRNATFWRNEGGLLVEMGKFADAKVRLGEALSIESGDPRTHATLADAQLQLKEYGEAEASYRNALRIEPRFGVVRANLAQILMYQRRLDEADKLLAESDEPESLMATARLAWQMATDPDDKLRNGERAVALAERVRTIVGDKLVKSLDILAAAYAEAGRFDDAIATAYLAVAAAVEAKDDALAAAAKMRLEGYRQHKPFRDPAFLQRDNPQGDRPK